MTVMMVPVTTGGKNRTTWEKNGLIASPTTPATMIAPKTAGRPPLPVATAVIVETDAKEMPWTRGSCEPKNGTPTLCRMVASPLTKSAAVTSRPCWAGDSPAAPPTMRGGAMTPPYIVRMCWMP